MAVDYVPSSDSESSDTEIGDDTGRHVVATCRDYWVRGEHMRHTRDTPVCQEHHAAEASRLTQNVARILRHQQVVLTRMQEEVKKQQSHIRRLSTIKRDLRTYHLCILDSQEWNGFLDTLRALLVLDWCDIYKAAEPCKHWNDEHEVPRMKTIVKMLPLGEGLRHLDGVQLSVMWLLKRRGVAMDVLHLIVTEFLGYTGALVWPAITRWNRQECLQMFAARLAMREAGVTEEQVMETRPRITAYKLDKERHEGVKRHLEDDGGPPCKRPRRITDWFE